MTLKRFTRANRRRADIDDVLAAYSAWRRECAAVRVAYRKWVRAAKSDACLAFAAYGAALEGEERAAELYARRVARVRRRPELDLVKQLAQLPSPFGAV